MQKKLASSQTSFVQSWGKYKSVVLAVALFLVLDLAVLVMNFYISYEFTKNAKLLSLAGRQSMLLQHINKSLYALDSESKLDAINLVAIENETSELKDAADLFNGTLIWLEKGGTARAIDQTSIEIEGLNSARFSNMLNEAKNSWQPYLTALNPVVNSENLNAADLKIAFAYSKSNNAHLISVMNDITAQIETDVNERAFNLRKIQAIGMSLAILNFIFILFKFLRKLRSADEKIESAQKETEEILNTIDDGIFLIDRNAMIGTQRSKSLTKILGMPIEAGENFNAVLVKLVGKETADATMEHIQFLIDNQLDEGLIKSFNPLSTVKIQNDLGRASYLSFKFNRVNHHTEGTQVLIAISDVTHEKLMLDELASNQANASTELDLVATLFKTDATILKNLLNEVQSKLLAINELLKRHTSDASKNDLFNHISMHVADIKSSAASINFAFFEHAAHLLEQKLRRMLNKERIENEDILSLPESIDDFYNKINLVRKLNTEIYHHSNQS